MAKILLVEDEPMTRNILKEFLRLQGHEVTGAENGRRALEIIKGRPANDFDLVITDIVMPELDGFEVIAAVSALEDPPKIIAMSGGSPLLDLHLLVRVARHMRTAVVLSKPISYKDLDAAVRSALKEA